MADNGRYIVHDLIGDGVQSPTLCGISKTRCVYM